jgi:hypothetical protein
MSPSGLGRRLRSFLFLDLFDVADSGLSGFGWHPHSGIATLTYLWQGSVRYKDTTGAFGVLLSPCGLSGTSSDWSIIGLDDSAFGEHARKQIRLSPY